MNCIRIVLASTIFGLLAGCGPKMAKTKPEEADLHGTFEADLDNGRVSVLTLFPDGSVSGSLVPVRRMHADGVNFRSIRSQWELTDPSMTPRGSWCVEFEGLFFRVYTDGSDIILRHSYDVLNQKAATYIRTGPIESASSTRSPSAVD